jgi:hypothetical protein
MVTVRESKINIGQVKRTRKTKQTQNIKKPIHQKKRNNHMK